MKGKPDPMKCWFLSRSAGSEMTAAITPTVDDSDPTPTTPSNGQTT